MVRTGIHPPVKGGRGGNGIAVLAVNRWKRDSDQELESGAIDCTKMESPVWGVYERCWARWLRWCGHNPQGRWRVLLLVGQEPTTAYAPPGNPRIRRPL